MFHDAQYTEDEYPHRVGWGHSSIAHTVAFGLLAKVRRVVMFHHDPLHTDAQLEAMLARAHELWGDEQNGLVMAYEGMEIEVTKEAAREAPARRSVRTPAPGSLRHRTTAEPAPIRPPRREAGAS